MYIKMYSNMKTNHPVLYAHVTISKLDY